MVLSDGIPEGLRAGSAGSVPSKPPNPDLHVLEELKSAPWDSKPVHNERLHMKPEDIPVTNQGWGDKRFYIDKLDLLTVDTIDTPHGSWRKMFERGQGWAIFSGYVRWCVGWKRTFVFKPVQPSESNTRWYMDLYAEIDGENYVKPLYMCRVFEGRDSNNPRPKCVREVFPPYEDPDPIQVDPMLVESRAKKLEAIAKDQTFFQSTESHDYSPFDWEPSFGIAGDTNRNLRADVWKNGKFTRIKARCPGGGEITWSICNHCGMVYKGSTTTKTLGQHKCSCSCNLAPNS